MIVNSGDTLTIDGTIISISGFIVHEPGEKVVVEEAFYTNGYWSKLCPDIYVIPKLSYVKLVGESCNYLLNAFVETKNIK